MCCPDCNEYTPSKCRFQGSSSQHLKSIFINNYSYFINLYEEYCYLFPYIQEESLEQDSSVQLCSASILSLLLFAPYFVPCVLVIHVALCVLLQIGLMQELLDKILWPLLHRLNSMLQGDLSTLILCFLTCCSLSWNNLLLSVLKTSSFFLPLHSDPFSKPLSLALLSDSFNSCGTYCFIPTVTLSKTLLKVQNLYESLYTYSYF